MRSVPLMSAALAACVGLAGCEGANTIPVNTAPREVGAQDQARFAAFITEGFRDPASAQFRNWRGYTLSNGDQAVCVDVNGKNAYGAYVGFEPYYLRLRDGAVAKAQVEIGASQACTDVADGSYSIAPAGAMFGY